MVPASSPASNRRICSVSGQGLSDVIFESLRAGPLRDRDGPSPSGQRATVSASIGHDSDRGKLSRDGTRWNLAGSLYDGFGMMEAHRTHTMRRRSHDYVRR